MGDSMPRCREKNSKCDHPWSNVYKTEKKTVVGDTEMILDREEVFFCDICHTILDENEYS